MGVDKVAYQACLEDRLPQNPVVNDEEPIEKCVEELSRTTQETTRANLRPSLPASIRMKYA
jgi:hypothetical protein